MSVALLWGGTAAVQPRSSRSVWKIGFSNNFTLPFVEHQDYFIHGIMDRTQSEQSKDMESSQLQSAKELLHPLGLSYEDVEDRFTGLLNGRWLEEVPYWRQWIFETSASTPQQLHAAVASTLVHWPIFRTIALKTGQQQELLVVRATSKYYHLAISQHADVETVDDLLALEIPVTHEIGLMPTGLLFRALAVRMKSTNAVGLIIRTNHVTYDATSFSTFIKDLDQKIRGRGHMTRVPTPYGHLLQVRQEYQNSVTARAVTSLHFRQLHGIHKSEEALWPPVGPPRYPRTEQDKGNRVIVHRPIPGLSRMESFHGIRPAIIFKAAIILLTVHHTHQKKAIMGMMLSGRSRWLSEDPSSNLTASETRDKAFNVAGPTAVTALSITEIDEHESVGVLLQRMEREQLWLSQNALVIGNLSSKLSEEDRKSWELAKNRQRYNWQPRSWSTVESQIADNDLHGVTNFEGLLVRRRSKSWDGFIPGVIWSCGLYRSNPDPEVQVQTVWNKQFLSVAEMEGVLEKLFKIAEWICKEESWSKEVGMFKTEIDM